MSSKGIRALAITVAVASLAACSNSRPAASNDTPIDPASCALCHGLPGRTGHLPGTDPLLAAAPPVPPTGSPVTVIGAHQAHMNPAAVGPLRGPIACNECHVVPQDFSHATNPPANTVQFGTLAQARGASPTYEPVSLGCAAVYCHGNFDFNGVKGTAVTMTWGGAAPGCTTCHGMPPTGHPALAGTVTPATCSQCHPATVNADGSINVASGAHVNGQAEVTLDCTSCHGTAGRTGNLPGTDTQLAAAPPAAPRGSPASVVGAHLSHLNPPSNGAFRAPLACNECHVVPTDGSHAVNPPANPVVFGTLATTQGNAPSFDPTSLGCAATYCHGGFNFNGVRGAAATPIWTDTGIRCIDCHGLPPLGHPALPGTVTAATCSQCHPATVNANGTVNVATGAHVNGKADVAANCTSCHGDAARTVPAGNPNALLPSAPPVPPAGSPASVVGTHLLHLTDSTIRSAISCNECHVVPDNPDHSIQFPPVVVFSPGTLATTQNATPSFDPTTLSCSTTYCHGSFAFGAVTGSVLPTPAWNATPTLACTGCHGMPPTGHQAVTPATPASCAPCHAQTVKADGSIDVAGGKHMDGLAQFTGNHPAGWVDPTQHGYSANTQGLQNCTPCHVAFGSASGAASSSCNDCHGGPAWQTNCTFCHGTPGRTGNVAGTDSRLAASPPVGPQGQTLTSQAAVGAHQKHVNPPLTGHLASPFPCNACHGTNLPTDIAHVNGLAVPVPFGGIAVTGGVQPAFDPIALGCSATYCHGNFTNGRQAASATRPDPVWTQGTALTCNSCHAMPNTSTARHGTHSGSSFNCSDCHNGIATGTGAANAAVVGPALHVNGAVNVIIAPANDITTTGAGTSRTCSGSCHGESHSSYTWTR